MSYYKNHKKKTIRILSYVAKHIKESSVDYEAIDLDTALTEAFEHYKHYLEMKRDVKYKPTIEHKSYK